MTPTQHQQLTALLETMLGYMGCRPPEANKLFGDGVLSLECVNDVIREDQIVVVEPPQSLLRGSGFSVCSLHDGLRYDKDVADGIAAVRAGVKDVDLIIGPAPEHATAVSAYRLRSVSQKQVRAMLRAYDNDDGLFESPHDTAVLQESIQLNMSGEIDRSQISSVACAFSKMHGWRWVGWTLCSKTRQSMNWCNTKGMAPIFGELWLTIFTKQLSTSYLQDAHWWAEVRLNERNSPKIRISLTADGVRTLWKFRDKTTSSERRKALVHTVFEHGRPYPVAGEVSVKEHYRGIQQFCTGNLVVTVHAPPWTTDEVLKLFENEPENDELAVSAVLLGRAYIDGMKKREAREKAKLVKLYSPINIPERQHQTRTD